VRLRLSQFLKLENDVVGGGYWLIALRPQTLKHIMDGWSHYTDTS
jgi:hypothetical protein